MDGHRQLKELEQVRVFWQFFVSFITQLFIIKVYLLFACAYIIYTIYHVHIKCVHIYRYVCRCNKDLGYK